MQKTAKVKIRNELNPLRLFNYKFIKLPVHLQTLLVQGEATERIKILFVLSRNIFVIIIIKTIVNY
jgi:hypothetical protein